MKCYSEANLKNETLYYIQPLLFKENHAIWPNAIGAVIVNAILTDFFHQSAFLFTVFMWIQWTFLHTVHGYIDVVASITCNKKGKSKWGGGCRSPRLSHIVFILKSIIQMGQKCKNVALSTMSYYDDAN